LDLGLNYEGFKLESCNTAQIQALNGCAKHSHLLRAEGLSAGQAFRKQKSGIKMDKA